MASKLRRITDLFRDESGNIVLWQWPNMPLWIFLATIPLRHILPSGLARTLVVWAGSIALLWWASLEITEGTTPFRRILGTIVLAVTIVGLSMRIL